MNPAVGSALPTVTSLITPLVDIDDRGVYFERSFTSWRSHIRHGAALAAALRARLDPALPPHVGVLLQNTPFFSAVLVAAGLSGVVPVGLDPVRRGAALERDISHADCQLVLADSASAQARCVEASGEFAPQATMCSGQGQWRAEQRTLETWDIETMHRAYDQ